MQCFIRDLPAVAPNYKADLIRFYNLKNGAQWSIECSALEIFLSAWHTHPVLSKLECYYGRDPNHRHMYSLYQQMYDSGRFWIGSEATNWAQNLSSNFTMSNNMTCKMVYSKSVVKGLRDEIKPICPSPFDLRLCWLNINMKLADTEDRFLEYVKSSAPVTAHYMDALQLYIYAIIKEMDVRSPNPWDIVPNKHGMEYHIFLNTYYHPIWIPTKVNNLMMYIFNNTHALVNSDTEKGLQLQLIMDLLPTDYQCESFAEVGSLCWTVNMFNEMIKAFKQNLNAPNTNKKILVNTDIDYRAFLEHTQTERLLKLSETSQNNLVTIATELRDDIVYSIEQSAAESTNKIAGVVQSGFDGLKKHFQQEASFDKSIAKADIAFINAEITKYTKSLEYLTRRVFELVGYILKNTMGAVIGDAAEKLVHLLVVIASAFNPLKWLFDGGSVVEIAEAAAELAQAAAKVVLSVTFMTAWSNLLYLSSHFATALADNQAYLENIGKLVESLSADTPPPDFEKQKELFIKGYNDYSPAVNIEDLTQINTYWELIIDEACDLLDSTEGLSSAGIKMATNKACFDAPGEVQKFIALNEEIFEFQFDMMDALTECVRASNSYEAATAISTGLDNIQEVVSKDRESNVLEELKMLAAYSSMLYKVSVIEAKSKYCNVLEYREGSRPEVCKTHDWNLANLLSRNQASYHSTQDFKTVPTRPAFTGDKAFIDLKDLYAGKVVRFQVPNSDWLVNRGWIPTNDRNKPIFVQRFEVYLPVGSTSEKQVSRSP